MSSGLLDTGRVAWNVATGTLELGSNLLSGDLPGTKGYVRWGLEKKYDTPAFGYTLEALTIVGSGVSLVGREVAGVNSVNRAFKAGEDVLHFEKHGSEIAQTLGYKNYSLSQYVQDANSVIKNGTFAPELNAYVSIPGGSGSAKGLMVGLDRATGEITTMHMKPISWFETKAPSLGWGAQPKAIRTDTIGPNPQSGWKWPY